MRIGENSSIPQQITAGGPVERESMDPWSIYTARVRSPLGAYTTPGTRAFSPAGYSIYNCRIALSKSTDADMICMHSMVRAHVVQDQVVKWGMVRTQALRSGQGDILSQRTSGMECENSGPSSS